MINKHAEKSLGILAIVALIVYFFLRNSKPSDASAQNDTLGYVPPNDRVDSIGLTSCPCSSSSPVASSYVKSASTISRQARF